MRTSVNLPDTRIALVAPLEYNTDARCLMVLKSNPRSGLTWEEADGTTGVVLFPNFHFRVRVWVHVTEDKYIDYKGKKCTQEMFICRLAQAFDYLYRNRHLINEKQNGGKLSDARDRQRFPITSEMTPGALDVVRAVLKLREHGIPRGEFDTPNNDYVRVRHLPDFKDKALGSGFALELQCRHHVVALALLHAFSIPRYTQSFKGGYLTLGKSEYVLVRALVHVSKEVSKKKTKSVWVCPKEENLGDYFLQSVFPVTGKLMNSSVRLQPADITSKWATCHSLAVFDHHLAHPAQLTGAGFIQDGKIVTRVLYGGVINRGTCCIQSQMASFEDARMRMLLEDMREEPSIPPPTDAELMPPPPPPPQGQKRAASETTQVHAKRMRLMKGELPYMNFYTRLKKLTWESDVATVFAHDQEDEIKTHLEVWVHAGMLSWDDLLLAGGALHVARMIEDRFPPLSIVREKYEVLCKNQ